MTRKKSIWIIGGICCVLILGVLGCIRVTLNKESKKNTQIGYEKLPADNSTEEALAHIQEDFYVDEGFVTNLPIVILELDSEVSDYKYFKSGQEVINEGVEPYSTGKITVIDGGEYQNKVTDEPSVISDIKIKKRGHTSLNFDKPQYLVKTVEKDTDISVDVNMLGMGKESDWILNGSMADKSMLRNYLSYRIASEIGEGTIAPDSRYCEVLFKSEKGYEYRGVYLLQETVSRAPYRVDIDEFKAKNDYTSYIVRRDRFTNYDVMLDTYGRISGMSEQWIGVKYPSAAKLTDKAKEYIEKDFSKIEQIIYSEDENDFKTYDKYIDIDSFVNYFIINEFFGNYDAGEHSTYMYKNSGGRLYIGPVWDFDQAMNNYFMDEMDAHSMAFQEKPFFERLCLDRRFIDLLKKRYGELRKDTLSETHIFSVIDETVAYLKSARQREWYRWSADYEDDTFSNVHNYYLQDIVKEDVVISRFNDSYEQEIYNIKTYLHKHGNSIQVELSKLYDLAEYNSSIKNENELLLVVIMILFVVPSILIVRKD